MDDFWQYMSFALAKYTDSTLFKSAIGCLADVARSCEYKFASKISIIENLL